jgi:hypothetical protein
MDTLLQLLGVFALSVVELWAAVPAGVALGLPPILVWLATVAGALVCIVVVVLWTTALTAAAAFGVDAIRDLG